MSLAAVALSLLVAQPAPRTVAVISDLHLGRGKVGDAWHPFEDFRWAPEFAAFLQALPGLAQGPVDLVLAGDVFELWQGQDGFCPAIAANRDLGCTEPDAVQRLDRAIAQHGAELAALQAFAARPGNRLVVLPGNHDAALLFPAVAARLRAALPGAILQADTGWWLSDDGKVLVDHGHEIGAPHNPNAFDGWPRPFLDGGSSWWCFWDAGKKHLRRPWGEQFVVEFYDGWEARFPVVDNVTEELAGAKLAMAAIGVPQTLVATGELLRFFFLDVSLSQFVHMLGAEDGKLPIWDLQAMRAGGDAALAAALPPEDPMGELLRGGKLAPALQAAGMARAIDAFDDAQLRAICDKEMVNRKAREKAGEQGLPIPPCPAMPGTLGGDAGTLGEGEMMLGAMAQSLLGGDGRALEARLRALRKESGKAFQTYVFGHTHAAQEPWLAITSGDWNPYAMNDGTWQRVVTPLQVNAYRKATGAGARQVLEASLSQLPPCYTFAWLPPGGRLLKSWRQVDGKWGFGDGRECAAMAMQKP